MNRKQHGVLSLVWLILSIAVGSFSIFQASTPFAIIYLAASIISFMIVIYSYCSKCLCRLHSCGHILPGLLTKLLPSRKKEKYRLHDFVGVLVPLLLVIIFPQFWLANDIFMLISFWLLLIFTIVEIHLTVCKECDNKYCPFNKAQ